MSLTPFVCITKSSGRLQKYPYIDAPSDVAVANDARLLPCMQRVKFIASTSETSSKLNWRAAATL